jgi:hypothetical protein
MHTDFPAMALSSHRAREGSSQPGFSGIVTVDTAMKLALRRHTLFEGTLQADGAQCFVDSKAQAPLIKIKIVNIDRSSRESEYVGQSWTNFVGR